jgi:uncharacterized protein (TIGR02270 family)
MGMIGDPASVPWIINQMHIAEIARGAGEAFTMITGVDLAYNDLDISPPEGFEAGPSERPEDEDVAVDADEDLPWPDRRQVERWWDSNKHRFTPGQRYLVGKPISIEQCEAVLCSGFQRQRIAAALELALLRPGSPLFETRAPGFRQERQLKSLSPDGGSPLQSSELESG